MYMPSNTVPVYRHGRKFYVSVEEFERIRDDERRHRRTLMQKAQNLPLNKSNSSAVPPPVSTRTSMSFYKPVQRSFSQPRDLRYGILRAAPMPVSKLERPEPPVRLSRSTLRFYDEQDDGTSTIPVVPIRLPTTATRSNSSDKVLDLRRPIRNPSTSLSYTGYVSDDSSVKRSLSAELIQASKSIDQPQVPPRRTNASTPQPTMDQVYIQNTASKLSNYFNRIPASTANASMKQSISQLTGSNLTYRNDFAVGRSTTESLSDENSSSPTMFIQRRNNDQSRYQRPELVVETDDDYDSQGQIYPRNTTRSQSNEGLTEKKRVRFADMEGFTLEMVSDGEQRRTPTENRLFVQRTRVETPQDLRRTLQPFRNSFYQNNSSRVVGPLIESKLATDV